MQNILIRTGYRQLNAQTIRTRTRPVGSSSGSLVGPSTRLPHIAILQFDYVLFLMVKSKCPRV